MGGLLRWQQIKQFITMPFGMLCPLAPLSRRQLHPLEALAGLFGLGLKPGDGFAGQLQLAQPFGKLPMLGATGAGLLVGYFLAVGNGFGEGHFLFRFVCGMASGSRAAGGGLGFFQGLGIRLGARRRHGRAFAGAPLAGGFCLAAAGVSVGTTFHCTFRFRFFWLCLIIFRHWRVDPRGQAAQALHFAGQRKLHAA